MDKKIFYKPKWSSYFSLALGIVFLVTMNIALMVLGALFVAVSAYVIFFIKDRVVAEITDKDVTLFYSDGFEKISFSDVYEWNTSENGIYIKTSDMKEHFVDTYCTVSACDALKKTMPEKESIMIAKNNLKRSERKGFFRKK